MIEIYKLFKSLYMKTYQKQNIKSEKKKKNLEHVSQKVIISIKYFYKWRRETRAPSTTNENVRKDKKF